VAQAIGITGRSPLHPPPTPHPQVNKESRQTETVIKNPIFHHAKFIKKLIALFFQNGSRGCTHIEMFI
jgi:hypothetical protein